MATNSVVSVDLSGEDAKPVLNYDLRKDIFWGVFKALWAFTFVAALIAFVVAMINIAISR